MSTLLLMSCLTIIQHQHQKLTDTIQKPYFYIASHKCTSVYVSVCTCIFMLFYYMCSSMKPSTQCRYLTISLPQDSFVPADTKVDVSKLTDAQMDEYVRMVRSGKKVSFG